LPDVDGEEECMKQAVALTPKKVILSAREIPGENWTAIGLLIFAAVIPVALTVWWEKHSPMTLPDLVTLLFMDIYIFAVVSTFAIIVLWGLNRLDLPNKFMSWLGAATVGEIAGLLGYVIHIIFKK
jgi:hypothetical protein